jgi:hypothetical protein
MVIFAVQHCGATQQFKEGVESLSSLTGLGVASIIMVVAISYDVGMKNDKGNSIFTLILSCFTIVLVGGIIYVEQKSATSFPAMYQFYTLTVFSIMWIVAACLVTFDGPFVVSKIRECRDWLLLGTHDKYGSTNVSRTLDNWKWVFHSVGGCRFVRICYVGSQTAV